MKICNRCKIEKEESEFNKNKNKSDGLQARCRDCNKKGLKKHYLDNPEYYKNKRTKRKFIIREYINSKKLKCSNCDENHISCLDFHHLENKELNVAEIGNLGWAKKKIDIELNKCIILCSNCHRKLHWNEKNTPLV